MISSNKIKLKDDAGIIDSIQEIAKETIKLYSQKFGIKAGHDPILTQSLLTTLYIIGTEVSIWYGEITGHIDLLGIRDDKLIIIEYKPSISQVYKGLSQVCTYAYMISKTLGIELDKIECIIYSPDLALYFNPEILEDIIEFIHGQNTKRQTRLTLRYNQNDLETELLRIIKFLFLFFFFYFSC